MVAWVSARMGAWMHGWAYAHTGAWMHGSADARMHVRGYIRSNASALIQFALVFFCGPSAEGASFYSDRSSARMHASGAGADRKAPPGPRSPGCASARGAPSPP